MKSEQFPPEQISPKTPTNFPRSGNVSILDKEKRAEVKKSIKPAILGQFVVIIMMIIMINILYGYSWNTTPLLKEKMKIAIFSNEDKPQLSLVSQALQYVVDHAPELQLNYKFVVVQGTHSRTNILKSVEKGEYWGAFLVNYNASVNLQKALVDSPYLYEPNAACNYWYDQGRDGASYQYALGSLGQSIASMANVFTKQTILIQFGAKGYNSSVVNPRVFANLVGVTTINVHPVENMGLHTAAGNGMLQLNLVSIIHAFVILLLYTKLAGRGIMKSHLVIFHTMHRVMGSFVLGIWPPIVILILGAGKGFLNASKFFQWWAFCWLFMTTLCGMYYFIVVIFGLGVGFLIGIWLLMLQVASSTGSIPIDAMPGFFQIGLGLPFTNAIEGSRAILFGTNKTSLSRNIGVFFIYIVFFLGLGVLVTYKEKFNIHLFLEEYEEPVKERLEEEERRASIVLVSENNEEVGVQPIAEPFKKIPIYDSGLQSVLFPLIKQALVIEVILSFFLVILLLITYGSTWDPNQYWKNIDIAYLNSDLGSVGFAADAAKTMYKAPFAFTIHVQSPVLRTFKDVSQDVENGKYWAAIVVDSEASSSLMRHLTDCSTTSTALYNGGKNAMHLVLDGGRSGTLLPLLLKIWASGFAATTSALVSAKILAQAGTHTPLCLFNPSVLANPVSIQTISLHAPEFSGCDASIGSTAMCLYLVTVAQIAIILASHRPFEKIGIYYEHRVLAKVFHVAFASIFVTFWPVLSLVWYGLHLNAGIFFSYWALLTLGMAAFASLSFMNSHLFGQAGGGVANIVMFALSQASSTASLPLELQNPFFKIGLALPYNQIVTGGRYVLFGSRLCIGRAIGVLIGWVLVVSFAAYRLEIRKQKFATFKKALAIVHPFFVHTARVVVAPQPIKESDNKKISGSQL